MHNVVNSPSWVTRPSFILSLIMTTLLMVVFAQSLHSQEEVPTPANTADSVDTETLGDTVVGDGEVAPAIQGAADLYMPMIFVPITLSTPILDAIGHPTGDNEWTLSWQAPHSNIVTFEIQESYKANFSTINNTYTVDGESSLLISKTPGLQNVFYYRVRALFNGEFTAWSNSRSVIGGYRDNFNNPDSGWAIRRTTYIERIQSWYENGNLIFKVEDSWDWGIVSPMVKAPKVPYVIEYRSEPAHLANLVSSSAVFGGDWPGEICPDYSTLPGVYEHDLCFNHFYNPNIIWYGPLKMAFERVDYLVWCPNCGGSPMKRLSDDYDVWFLKQPIPFTDHDEWNTWRIEVRETGITFIVNGYEFAHSDDTRWINYPYSGLFVSTDEYSNSTWRFDYYEVMPLDE